MTTPEQADAIRRLHAQTVTARALAESASLAEAAPRILRVLGEILSCDHGAVWTVDLAGTSIRCLETWHRASIVVSEFDAATRGAVFRRGVGLPGRVWESARPAWIADVTQDSNFPRARVAAREGLHGAMGFPIVLGGSVFGMLEFFSRTIREPDQGLLEMLGAVGSQIGQLHQAPGGVWTGTALTWFEDRQHRPHVVAVLTMVDLPLARPVELTLSRIDRPLNAVTFASHGDAPCPIARSVAPPRLRRCARWRAHLRKQLRSARCGPIGAAGW